MRKKIILVIGIILLVALLVVGGIIISNANNPSVETKIMKYDVKTKKTIEVDMEEIKEIIKTKNGGNIPNLTHTCTSKDFPPREGINDGASASRVINTSKFPYNATCRIKFADNNGNEKIYSGALVGKNIALTAAHCVLNENGVFKDWTIQPGYNENETKIEAGLSEIYYSSAWLNNKKQDINNDWAICVLDQDLGSAVGTWYNLQIYDGNDFLNGADIRIVGYARNHGYMLKGDKQYETLGEISKASDTRIYYKDVLESGFGGSPVLCLDDCIIAIDVDHINSPRNDIGVRITQEMLDIILSLR